MKINSLTSSGHRFSWAMNCVRVRIEEETRVAFLFTTVADAPLLVVGGQNKSIEGIVGNIENVDVRYIENGGISRGLQE